MAYRCVYCPKSFPTERGLGLHLSRGRKCALESRSASRRLSQLAYGTGTQANNCSTATNSSNNLDGNESSSRATMDTSFDTNSSFEAHQSMESTINEETHSISLVNSELHSLNISTSFDSDEDAASNLLDEQGDRIKQPPNFVWFGDSSTSVCLHQ